ncbi:sodium/nucleoside cotransporter [Plakobranchus ocellatus]|uniref:Sodium/nucleoside cotransporter n=1 Tax=Plakobranchus ocellatus TaxID=259542 RepID=A0AAV4DKD4_9GAST|nr:sodium/nucleoside cotransporter [Plakobranchus ocellatus]
MTTPAGKENLAFAGELPLHDMKSSHYVVDDTQVTLQEADSDQALNHRSRTPAHAQDDGQGDFQEPKPKEFNLKDHNAFIRALATAQNGVSKGYSDYKSTIWPIIGAILLALYLIYFGFAMDYEFGSEASWRLLVCTVLGVVLLALYLLGDHLQPLTSCIGNLLSNPHYNRIRTYIRWALYLVSTIVTVALIIWLVALDNPENLLSLAGLAAFILLCFVTSYSPAQVDWHPVFWGFSLQFYFAAFILKTDVGFETFKWLGDRVTEFLAYSDAGAAFVFGDYAKITPLDGTKPIEFTGAFSLHFFAFQLMPVVTFFSTVISVLYYLGVMQAIIKVIGRFLSFCLGTTPAESLNAAGNIFIAMTESPLMIRPFIPTMTRSELHAVMTGGFATIAGSVLGAYIGFGVPADHLLSASVMSAPAALAISKLSYPEIDEPITTSEDYKKMEKTKEGNVIEAACNGAIVSAKIIASIIVNVVAFLSLLKFVNATLIWLGERVGKKNFTFQYICSYVLYPVALFMGTKTDDCRRVAELVGVKTFTNEFIAYEQLAKLLDNRKTFDLYVEQHPGNWTQSGDDIFLAATNQTLAKGILSRRSEIIATYALCGFSNFGSMGILLGALSSLAPRRRSTMAKIILRAMIAGNVACFFTACIAGEYFKGIL